jgi:hypothetical protein
MRYNVATDKKFSDDLPTPEVTDVCSTTIADARRHHALAA